MESPEHSSHNSKVSKELAQLIGRVGTRVDGGKFISDLSVIRTLVEKLEAENDELRIKAGEDALTGAKNRAKFYEEVITNASRLNRIDGYSFGLAVVDLNNFKYINDTFGHATGDLVLKQTCNYLSDKVRRNDAVYRFGGDEFVVYFDAVKAEDFTEKMRYSEFIDSMRFELQTDSYGVVPFSASVGLAIATKEQISLLSRSTDEESKIILDELIDFADKSMYTHKALHHSSLKS